MHIVVLGATTVGVSIAETLSAARQNIVVIDDSPERLATVEERLDVSTILGSPCDAITLFQAGVTSADLCLAVTQEDELNLVGASLAKSMGARRSIARMFRPSYLDTSTFDYRRHFQIDRLISLEQLTALELAKAIRLPGLYAVENFARGDMEVQEVGVEKACQAVGIPLKDLDLPVGTRIGLISRPEGTSIPGANDIIQIGDHVTLLGDRESLTKSKRLFETRSPPTMNIIIAGGGEIGYQLARVLEKTPYRITLMETDPERARFIASKLSRQVMVVTGDATLQSDLQEARVNKADVFVAATGRDAENIVCALEARELGCERVMCVVRRPDFTDILEKTGIDSAVSPREVIDTLVSGYIDSGPVVSRTSMAEGEAELWEVEILPGSPVIGVPLKDLGFTKCLIAAIVREDYVRVPGANDTLRAGDTAVLLLQSEVEADVLSKFTG